MRQLEVGDLQMSRDFVCSHGRNLEIARFDHAFGSAPAETVLEALLEFQNTDGGFGKGLEPDLRTPASSALCTSIALQIFREVDIPKDHPLIAQAVNYLLTTFDHDEGTWRIIPPIAENSPRAPWWYQAGQEEALAKFSLNPTAELLGYLHDFSDLVPREILIALSDRVLSELDNADKLEMHDLLCCLRLLQTPSFPERARLLGQLRKSLTTVECDPGRWGGYSLRPIQIANSPESPFFPELKDAVAANLDYEIATRNPDGSWTPTWTWDDQYPEDWAEAKEEWTGVLIVEKLLTLKRFGRICS